MKDNKESNINIVSIIKWLRSDKGKKYSFVVFYLIFFIFIAIFIAFTNNYNANSNINNTDNNEIEDAETMLFNISNLNNNYNIKYSIYTDKEVVFTGNKTNNQITLANDNNSYSYTYQEGELTSNNENEELFYKLLDIYEFKKIIKTSTYVSKTELASGEVSYNYTISSNLLGEYLNIDSDSLNNNNIVVSTDTDNYIKSVSFELNDLMNKQYKILIEYEAIDE